MHERFDIGDVGRQVFSAVGSMNSVRPGQLHARSDSRISSRLVDSRLVGTESLDVRSDEEKESDAIIRDLDRLVAAKTGERGSERQNG